MTAPLWLRKWSLKIADAKDEKAWDLSSLRIVFDIKRTRENANWATFSIYNLTKEMEMDIIMNGNRLIFEAGYQGYLQNDMQYDESAPGISSDNFKASEAGPAQYGCIFDGKIMYPARHKEGNTDYVLSLLCVDGRSQLYGNFVAHTANKGINQRQIVETACGNAREKVVISKCSTDLNPQSLPRGKVFFGTPQKYLADVARGNSGTFWINDGQINVTKWTDPIEGDALVVSPTTGLIGMPQQTQYGAAWTMLLNPNVKIESKIQLKDSEINELSMKPGDQYHPLDEDWIYQVTELTHKGDTYGNEWYTECNGVSRYGKNSLFAIVGSKNINPNGV